MFRSPPLPAAQYRDTAAHHKINILRLSEEGQKLKSGRKIQRETPVPAIAEGKQVQKGKPQKN